MVKQNSMDHYSDPVWLLVCVPGKACLKGALFVPMPAFSPIFPPVSISAGTFTGVLVSIPNFHSSGWLFGEHLIPNITTLDLNSKSFLTAWPAPIHDPGSQGQGKTGQFFTQRRACSKDAL